MSPKGGSPPKGPSLAVLGLLALMAAPLLFGPAERLRGRLVGALAPVLAAPLASKPELSAITSFVSERTLSKGQADLVMDYFGRRYLPFQTVMGLTLLFLIARGDKSLKWRTRHGMESLMRVSAEHFKCLSPIVKCGPITEKDNFEGEWALAKSPLQFALEGGLLSTSQGEILKVWEVLDRETGLPRPKDEEEPPYWSLDLSKLRAILVEQLGRIFPGDPRKLPGPQRGLAAAFLAHMADDKDSAMRIFDSLSASWEPRRPEEAGKSHGETGRGFKGERGEEESPLGQTRPEGAAKPKKMAFFSLKGLLRALRGIRGSLLGGGRLLGQAGLKKASADPYRLDLTEADKLLEKLSRSGDLSALSAQAGHESFVNVWLMGLLTAARAKGALPSSMWIWLKPTDRSLFYALNQVGGRTAWTEAAGAWSHFEAEKGAGAALPDPVVETAVEALQRALWQEGYLPVPPEKAPKQSPYCELGEDYAPEGAEAREMSEGEARLLDFRPPDDFLEGWGEDPDEEPEEGEDPDEEKEEDD